MAFEHIRVEPPYRLCVGICHRPGKYDVEIAYNLPEFLFVPARIEEKVDVDREESLEVLIEGVEVEGCSVIGACLSVYAGGSLVEKLRTSS